MFRKRNENSKQEANEHVYADNPRKELKEKIKVLLAEAPTCLSRISIKLNHSMTEISEALDEMEGQVEKRGNILENPVLQMWGIARPSFKKKLSIETPTQ